MVLLVGVGHHKFPLVWQLWKLKMNFRLRLNFVPTCPNFQDFSDICYKLKHCCDDHTDRKLIFFELLIYLCFSDMWTSNPFLVWLIFSQKSQWYSNWSGKCLDSTWFLTFFLPPCENCKQMLHFHFDSPASLKQNW